MERISVISPFYNGNQYIESLMHTIAVSRDYIHNKGLKAEVELIIVNDSPDVTVELPDNTYGLNFHVIIHEHNSGIHQARVTGLQHCKGDYILFLDQDDTISEDFFAEMLLKVKDYDVVIGNAYIENAEKEMIPLYRTSGHKKKLLLPDAYIKTHNQIVSPGQCMIRKAAIPQEWYRCIVQQNGSDDLFLWLLLFYSNARFCFLDKCLYIHHYTGKNLSASGEKMSMSSLEVAEYLKHIDWIPEKIIDPLIRARKYRSQWRNSGFKGKMKVLLNNYDLICFAVFWKLRCLF